MDQGPFAARIKEAFDAMPAQLQAAARYVLDRPHDVALLSMREQARRAGVQPATMTRLAQHLGEPGYERLRQLYAEAIREGEFGFSQKASAQQASQRLRGDRALAADILQSVAAQLNQLAEPASLDNLVEAARTISRARRVFCLGLRSSHAAAWHLHYVLSLIGVNSTLLHGIGGTDGDVIGQATPKDVLIATSVLPYTRLTVELADYASTRGVPLIAITDSPVAPLAQRARHVVLVPTASPSFFHTMAPAFVAADILGSLVAGRAGDTAIEALQRFDKQLSAFNTHLKTRSARDKS